MDETKQLLTMKEQREIIEAAKSVAMTGNLEKYRVVHASIVSRLLGNDRGE